MTPIDEKEPEGPELSQEEVEEIVGGLGGTLGSGQTKRGRHSLDGVYGSRGAVVEYGSGLLDYGSAP